MGYPYTDEYVLKNGLQQNGTDVGADGASTMTCKVATFVEKCGEYIQKHMN